MGQLAKEVADTVINASMQRVAPQHIEHHQLCAAAAVKHAAIDVEDDVATVRRPGAVRDDAPLDALDVVRVVWIVEKVRRWAPEPSAAIAHSSVIRSSP